MKKLLPVSLFASLALAAAPLASAHDVWAVTSSSQLIRFDSDTPGTTLSSVGLSGLVGSDGTTSDPFGTMLEITFANGTLYGLDTHANLYTVNITTGAATRVSSSFAPAGFDGGLAFDPFIPGGGLRFVSDAAENVALSLGGAVTAGPDVFFASDDVNNGVTPAFSALAIDVDFGIGYAIDANLDALAITYDANFSEFFTVGDLGVDITSLASIDFLNGSTLIASFSEDAFTSSFYTIDIATGAATFVGDFNQGILAIASPIPEPSTYAALLGAAALGLVVYRRRRAARA